MFFCTYTCIFILNSFTNVHRSVSNDANVVESCVYDVAASNSLLSVKSAAAQAISECTAQTNGSACNGMRIIKYQASNS